MRNFTKVKVYVIEFVKLVLISTAIIIPIRYFLIQPFIVNGASMEDTFYNKEYLIIDEITYRFKEPQRGDVIIFKFPKDPSQYFIKRIIGLPNEKVEIRNGYVLIYNDKYPDGKILDETSYLDSEILTYPDKILQLKDNEYFVMGDNRSSSLDSRIFGVLAEDFIIGRVWLRGWPIDRMTVFETMVYPE